MSRAVIAAVASVPFGKKTDVTDVELGAAAIRSLLNDAGVSPDQVGAAYGGSSYGGMLLAQRVMQAVGVSGPPIFTVENACASGASAVHLAYQAVSSDQADVVVAFGTESLSQFGGGTLPLTTRDHEIEDGLVMPAGYAMRAQRYMVDFGATAADLAMVSVKNRANGAKNPRAHFQKGVTVEQVLESREVAAPLRLLNCCPNSDGASAALITRPETAAELGLDAVGIAASVVRSGQFHNRPRDMTWPDITHRAAAAAYEQAGMTPDDLSFVELHDAFSISELLHAEGIGIADRGRAFVDLRNGEFAPSGSIPINPSGGLMSRGHPVGASGVAQVVESYLQLTGKAEGLQLSRADVALTQVTGGGVAGVDNGACGVHILTAPGYSR